LRYYAYRKMIAANGGDGKIESESCVCLIMVHCADRPETAVNHVDSDVEIPSDTVKQTVRKLELVIYLASNCRPV